MPDEIDPPEPSELSAQDVSSVLGEEVVPMRSPLVPGQRWHEYQIGEQIESENGWCYQAVNVGMLEDVELRVFPQNDQTGLRAQTWRELQSLEMPGLQKGIDAFEEGGFCFEVSRALPKLILREWASIRKVSLEDVQELVQQISDVLIAVHDRGLVHLNLRPETIHVKSEDGLGVVIGGLGEVTTYNQAGLIPVPVDPFYAPPEAAGLSKHSPGAVLRAWDWWSVGRILQEVVLGRHILSMVFNRDVSRPTPELRTRAEALLLERDPHAPRAGAVELMPPMSQRLTDLLRGLLASSRSGRWGTDEVLRWLRQQPVKDRYGLGRNEELFAWKDRVFTIDEAAEFFSRDENWAEGETNLFDTEDSMTLVSFVGERTEYRQLRQRIEELHTFMQIPGWRDLPEKARRTAITSAAWLLLGGEDAKLILYGHRIDAPCIKGLFSRGSLDDGVALVKAYTALPFIQMIEQADPDAARLFSSLGGIVSSETIVKAVAAGWLNLGSAAEYARLVQLAMEPERKLLDLCAGLKEKFACSRQPNVEHLLQQAKRTRVELVLLAFTAAQPERYGFVTHEDWKNERRVALEKRGAILATGMFWLRLEQIQKAGYVLYGPWKIVLAIWCGVAIAAGWSFGYGCLLLWVLGAVAGGVVLRFVAVRWLTFLMRRRNPQASPWRFLSETGRCKREAGVVLVGEDVLLTVSAIGREFAALQADLAKLDFEPAPASTRNPGLVAPAWFGTVASWAFLLAMFVLGHWNQFKNEPPEPIPSAAMAIEKAMTEAPVDENSTVEDRFFGDPRKHLERWDVAKPAVAPAVALAKIKLSGSDDVANALIDGQRLLLSYQQNTIDAIIAVPVGGTKDPGLILYDGRNRRVIGRQKLLPAQMPSEKSWFEVDKLKVFYAGAPSAPPLPPPKPIVDPNVPVDTMDLPEREVRRGAYQNVTPVAEQKPINAQPLSEALDTMTP